MVIDMAMQVHGAAGLSGDTVLSHLYATARTLRIADGPDEVHLGTIAKLELQRAAKLWITRKSKSKFLSDEKLSLKACNIY